MSPRRRVPLIQPVRTDTVSSIVERKLNEFQRATEAQRYHILRWVISYLSIPTNLTALFDQTVLSRCMTLFNRFVPPSASDVKPTLLVQRSNLRQMEKSLNQLKDVTIPIEDVVFRVVCLHDGRRITFSAHSLSVVDRQRLQAERERQAVIGWSGLLPFLRGLFESAPAANDFALLRALAEGVAWEFRKQERQQIWLWGLFLKDRIGRAERIAMSIFEGGTGEVTMLATRIQDADEGEKLRLSIEQAKWAAACYLRQLSLGYRESLMAYDLLLQIGERYYPYGYQGASLGLPLAVMIVAHFLQAPLDQETALTGEIDADGTVYGVKGASEKAKAARVCGAKRVMIPASNTAEVSGAGLDGLQVIGIRNLEEACDLMFQDTLIARGYRALPVLSTSPVVQQDGQKRYSIKHSVRLIGRAAELLWLQQRINRALSGQGGLYLIAGEAGVGKTKLMKAAQEYARTSGMLVLCGHCFYQQALVPYLPFMEALLSLDHDPAENSMQQRKSSDSGDWKAQLSKLRQFSAQLKEHGQPEQFSPASIQVQLFDHTMSVLQHLSQGRGVVLCVEDLQWGDSGSMQLLHYLARQLTGRRLSLLATYRSEELDSPDGSSESPLAETLRRLTEEGFSETMVLGNLALEDVHSLVGEVVNSRSVPVWVSDRIYRETNGNPLFVLEVLKWWQDTGVLGGLDEEWTRLAQTGDTLPPRIYDLIARRLNRLHDTEREVLEVAAVGGERFEVDGLASALSSERVEVLRHLHRLERRYGIISSAEGSLYQFVHGKIQEVLYRELPETLRRAYHAAWARGLMERVQAGVEVPVEALATHLYRGGSEQQAVPYLQKAGERAWQVSAFREAQRYWEQATKVLAHQDEEEAWKVRIHIRLRLGRVYHEAGAWDAASACLKQAFREAKRTGNRQYQAEALMRLGTICMGRNQWDAALKLYGRSLQLYITCEDQQGIARVFTHIGSVYLWRGQLDSAKQNYQKALNIADSMDDRALAAQIISNLGTVAFTEGDEKLAIRYYEASAQQLNDIYGLAMIKMNLGMVHERTEQWVQARLCHQKSVELFERMGSANRLANAYVNYARALARTGDIELAAEICHKGRVITERLRDIRGLAEAKRVEGLITSLRGEWEKTKQALDESLELCQQANDPQGLAETYDEYAQALVRQGLTTQATALLHEALSVFRANETHTGVQLIERRLTKIERVQTQDKNA